MKKRVPSPDGNGTTHPLLKYFGYLTARNCSATLPDSKTETLFHCDGVNKFNIDLGIITTSPISAKQMVTIQGKLEEIPTLLKIDLVDFNTVDEEFKKIALEHTRDIHK